MPSRVQQSDVLDIKPLDVFGYQKQQQSDTTLDNVVTEVLPESLVYAKQQSGISLDNAVAEFLSEPVVYAKQQSNTFGYNLALEFLEAQNKAFEFTEAKINGLIGTLALLNDHNRDLQKFSASLTHAKKDKKDADFSEDKEMKEIIDRVHALNPQILGAASETLKPEDYRFKVDDIETTLTLLDSTVKDQVSKINETTMYVNQSYEDRIQFTENAQKTLEMLIRHIDSILSKIKAA